MTGHLEVVTVDQTEIEVLSRAGVHLVVHAKANLVSGGALSDGAFLEIDIAYDTQLKRVVAESVTVNRPGEGSEVTARLMREVKVQESIVAVALVDMVKVHRGDDSDDPSDWLTRTGQEQLDAIRPMRERSRSEVLDDAAIVYTLATLANWPPLKTVAERLEVSQSTATRLVAESGVRADLG